MPLSVLSVSFCLFFGHVATATLPHHKQKSIRQSISKSVSYKFKQFLSSRWFNSECRPKAGSRSQRQLNLSQIYEKSLIINSSKLFYQTMNITKWNVTHRVASHFIIVDLVYYFTSSKSTSVTWSSPPPLLPAPGLAPALGSKPAPGLAPPCA